MSASVIVFSLPIPLILLIHLHILEYPHANKPEYDHNIFNPRVRGLKERTKLLEDISYFLVGRIEGPSSAKNILAAYPCLVPSDTVAFRTSLSKYVEGLRHNAVYPAPKGKSLTGQYGSGHKVKGTNLKAPPPDVPVPTAWWWKDVVVRKSLLEECAGERFERLLLALSTHALYKYCPPSGSGGDDLENQNLNDVLRSQPMTYASLLRKSKHARHAWAYSASILLQRETNLHILKEHLLQPSSSSSKSKYKNIPTPHLIALLESKRADLLRSTSPWAGPSGEGALDFLAFAAGIKLSFIANSSAEPAPVSYTSVPDTQSIHPAPQAQAQPLPIAAAHHPLHLKKIRKPVFVLADFSSSTTTARGTQASELTSKPVPRISALALGEVEKKTRCALEEALGRVRSVGRELAERVEVREGKGRRGRGGGAGGGGGVRKKGRPAPAPDWVCDLDLWEPTCSTVDVDFQTRPTPDLLASLSLALDQGLEAQIDEIRENVLPAYPPLPDLTAPRIPYPHPHPETAAAPVGIGMMTSTPRGVRKEVNRAGEKKNEKKGDGTQKKKQKPRKSIRISLALHAQRRPSLFGPPTTEDEDVNQMINSIANTSEDDLYKYNGAGVEMKTPRATKVKRLFTGSRTVKGTKEPFMGVLSEPAVPLPSVSFEGLLLEDEDKEWGGDDVCEGGTEEYGGDGGSMTLKDILLSADMTGFALLDEGEEVGGDVDESFGWE